MNNLETNININSSHGSMNYIVQCEKVLNTIPYNDLGIKYYKDDIIYINYSKNIFNDWLIRNKQYWLIEKYNPAENIKSTQFVHLYKLKLYFPNFSIDTYDKCINYIFSINFWIDQTNIYLGSFLFNRLDALAASPVLYKFGQNYYDYIEVYIPDPYDIIKNINQNYNINNNSLIINLSLHPVEKSQTLDNTYIKNVNYTGGQNIFKLKDNSLNLKLKLQLDQTIKLFTNINYQNDNYKNLKDYISNVYNITQIDDAYFELFLQDDSDIYKRIYQDALIGSDLKDHTYFEKPAKITKMAAEAQLIFSNWDGWHEGLNLISFFTLTGESDFNGEKKQCEIFLKSNKIPFTKEVMKYFLYNSCPDHVDLNKIIDNMAIYNINAINKIQNNIIQIDKPEDPKSNISIPIFYNTQDIQNIIIHPEVTENICINLDLYKSKIKVFKIKIGGVIFTEIGRTNLGVLFKIIGNSLPKDKDKRSGLYYILNEQNELVVSGNYKYIV